MSYTICSRFKGEHIVYAGYTICTPREHIVYGAFCGSTKRIYPNLMTWPILLLVRSLPKTKQVSMTGKCHNHTAPRVRGKEQ